jgi:hypothetical protein
MKIPVETAAARRRRRQRRLPANVHTLRPAASADGRRPAPSHGPATVIDFARARARRTSLAFDTPPEGTAA